MKTKNIFRASPKLASNLWRSFSTGNKLEFGRAVSALSVGVAAKSLCSKLIREPNAVRILHNASHLFASNVLRGVFFGNDFRAAFLRHLIYCEDAATAQQIDLIKTLSPMLRPDDLSMVYPVRIKPGVKSLLAAIFQREIKERSCDWARQWQEELQLLEMKMRQQEVERAKLNEDRFLEPLETQLDLV